MKFTVVIPAYNSAQYLTTCLDSLAAQDLSRAEFEVVLADDCSADATVARATDYAARLPNLRVIALKHNGGPGAARNAGLDAARGDWVLFLDSDDELAPDCLSALDRFIQDSSAAGLAAIGYDWTAQDLAPGLQSSKRVGRRDGRYLSDRKVLLRQYLTHRMDGSVIYTAVRRSLLNAHGIRFAGGVHEDVDFIFRVYFHAPVCAYLDRALYKKNNRPASIVNTISAAHISGYFRAWKAIGDLLEGLPLDAAERSDYADCYRYGTIAVVATRVREVIRHGTDASQRQALFELIFRLIRQLIEPEAMARELARARTVYFTIAGIFWRVMNATEIAATEKQGVITQEVAALAGKSWSCTDLHHSLFLRPDEVRTCCKRFFVDGEMRGDVVLFKTGERQDAALEPKAILDAKRDLHQKINSGEASACDGCPFLEFGPWSSLNQLDIRYLSLEYHSVCNLECTYCSEDYYGGKEASYDIAKTLHALTESGSLAQCTLIVWGGGEPVIGKGFDLLLDEFAENLPVAQQRVLTNSVRRSKALERLIQANRAQIVTSIDAGTEDTFRRIRGRPGLDRVCRNLKAYAAIKRSRVTIKYIFTEGNTEIAEVRRFAELMDRWQLLQCNFQISGDFKNEHIALDVAEAMVLMFGLLRKAGAEVVYFDELLRHRLGALIDVNDLDAVARIHALAEFDFIATPARYPVLAIWGAGQQARYFMESSTFFKHADLAYFVDSTPSKIGTRFFDKEVRDPAALLASDLPVLIAAVQGYPLILEQYRALGLPDSRLIRDLIL